jgi:uncharacterized damage-inducible protein DinB
MTDHLLQLMRHMAWADSLMWRAVRASPAANEDERMRNLLYHMHSVHWAYLQLLRSEPLEIPEPTAFADLGAIERWARDYYAALLQFTPNVDQAALSREIRFPWAQQLVERYGEVQPADLGQALLQVALHTTYHRGQIATRIRELGGTPPLTDFIAWIWSGQPDPDWSRPDQNPL